MLVLRSRLALALLLLLAGCRTLPEDSLAEPEDIPDTLAFADDEADEVVGEGPILRLALRRTGIEAPHEIALANQSQVILTDLYYDGLVEARSGELVPALAEAWEANDDYTQWTFRLNPERIDAGDVVASFEAVLASEAHGQPAMMLGHVASIRDGGDQSVVFELDRSDAGLPWLLSGVRYSVYGPEGVPTSLYVVDVTDRDHTRFRAEGQTDVVVSWADTAMESLELLYSGEVDAAMVENADYPVAAEDFGDPGDERAVTRFYMANLASPIMANPALRRTVIDSINASKASEFGSTLHGDPQGLIPDPMAAYTGAECDVCSEGSDLGSADPVGEQIVVGYVASTQSPIAESIASDIREAGFDAVRQQFSAEDLATAIEIGEVDLFAFGLAAESPSPDSVVAPLVWSQSPLNPARLADETIDTLVEKALVTGNDAERWALLSDAAQLVVSERVVVPVSTLNSGLIWTGDAADDFPLRPDGSIEIESAE